MAVVSWLSLIAAALLGLAAHDGLEPPSASIGKPNRGALRDGVQLTDAEHWEVVAEDHAWGTRESVANIIRAVHAVEARFPGGHKLHIGDLSREHGGRLYPHRSHQSGRDVDLGYYYLPGVRGHWYRHATPRTLDRERTWALLEALVADGGIEYLFMDRSVQRMLREHAASLGVDEARLDEIFQHGSHHPAPIVRHTWGHATHMHVRFVSAAACARGDDE